MRRQERAEGGGRWAGRGPSGGGSGAAGSHGGRYVLCHPWGPAALIGVRTRHT